MIVPRQYQIDGVNALRAKILAGYRRILLVCPTGGGKTVIASEVIKGALKKLNPSIMVAHRRELITQASNKLKDNQVPHTVMLSGKGYKRDEPVQVISIQTFGSWVTRRGYEDPPFASIIIIDEAHHTTAAQYRKLLSYYPPETIVIGITATPIRSDGIGLGGDLYETMVVLPQVPWMIENGFLVPVAYKLPAKEDFLNLIRGVKKKGTEFDPTEMSKLLDKPTYIGDVISNWNRLAGNRTTLVFAQSVAHSVHLKEAFCYHGIAAEHVDGETKAGKRDEMFAALSAGELKVLSNVGVAVEGTDVPMVSCISDVQPTKSLPRHLQKLGRGTRIFPGKENLLVLDHVGNLHRHGRIDREFPWDLSDKQNILDKIKETVKSDPKDLICPNCDTLLRKPPCPDCGWVPETQPNFLEYIEAMLVDLDKKEAKEKAKAGPTEEEKIQWLREAMGYGNERNWKPGAAANMFNKKFKHFPPRAWKDFVPLGPSLETARNIEHFLRKRAYAQRKDAK